MKKLILAIIVVGVLTACSSNKAMKKMTVDQKMARGNELFELKKYNKAIPFFTDVAFERNSAFTAEAQMKLADSYFKQNKFLEARFEYEEVIRLFKEYAEINRAYFQVGVCYFEESLSPHYTQIETNMSISSFETYLEKFPKDSKRNDAIDYINKCHYKLLEKKYLNGYTYYRISDYSAALMYFDELTELGNTDKIDKNSLYYSAQIHIKRKDSIKAEKLVTKLTQKYPDSKEAKKITKAFTKLKK
jgi:outer membrane protein assembly factor BamD